MSWLVDTLIATGALIAVVLLLRRPVARWFGPGMAYALWALPLLRLALPPLTLPAEPAVSAPSTVTVLAGDAPAAVAPDPGLADIVWTFAPLFQAVWLAGVLAFLIWRAWGYRAMRRSLLANAVGVGEAQGVRLIESPAARGPVAFGIFDPVVALPSGFMAAMPPRERDLAIAHELEHHNGRDLAVNIAVQPLLALHWFNPLAWLAWRALRRDQEAACDARVLAAREPATREAYGRLIAAFARDPSPALASPLACPILHDKSIIHRLRSLTMSEPTPRRQLAGRMLIGAAALALPLTATITHAAGDPAAPPAPTAAPGKVEQRQVRKIVIVDNPDGSTIDDAALHTRTVERNGKTIVLKTRTPLSDAEAEERIAKAEASMGQVEAMSWTDDEASEGPGKTHVTRQVVVVRHGEGTEHAGHAPGEHREVRTMVMTHDGPVSGTPGVHIQQFATANCGAGQPVTAQASQSADGKQRNAHVVICAHDGDKAGTLVGLRRARDKVAADPKLPADLKAEVLKQLDAEIAKFEKQG